MNANFLHDIKRLTDQQLLANTDKLAQEERRISLLVLQHLREVEIRRLFVDLGFDSMYKYCLHRLKYSEGEAQRRLSAARLLKELPEIESHIQSGDLNITNLSAVQSFVRAEKLADKTLTREEKLELVSSVQNKSTRDVKLELIKQSHQPALLAEKFHLPSASLPVPMEKFEALMTEDNQQLLQDFKNLYAHDLADLSNHSVLLFLLKKAVQHKKKKLGLTEKITHTSNAPLPSAEDVTMGLHAVFRATKASESSTNIDSSFSTKSKELTNANERRQQSLVPTKPAKSVFQNNSSIKSIKKLRTAIPIKIQRQIWIRANACCEYIDSKSKIKCLSKFALETDHIVPLALDGSNDIHNLQLLCRAHNSRRAIKTFGTL